MKKTNHRFQTVAGIAVLAAATGLANAGTLVVNSFANGTDAASGISPSITYTHLVDVNTDDGGATINGVVFNNTGSYTLTGAGLTFQDHNSPANDVTGSGLEDLLDDFLFNGDPATLTLSGLTAGETYKLRLYVGGFGSNEQTFSFDDTAVPTVVTNVPRNAGADAVPGSIDYTYTLGAGDTDLQVIIDPSSGSNVGSFHFYGFSNEGPPVGPTTGYSMPITFTNYSGRATLDNFPVLVKLTTANTANYGGFLDTTDGYDLRFWSNSELTGTELAYEVESFDSSGTSYIWVKVPSFSHNGTIWASWGEPDFNSQQGYTTDGSVWSEGFVGVWHMTEKDVQDSTSNNYHGTGHENTATAAGHVGQGLTFDGAGDYVGLGSGVNPLDSLVSWSLEWWHNQAADHGNGGVLSVDPYNDTGNRFICQNSVGLVYADGWRFSGGPWPEDSTWHHFVLSKNGSAWTLYKDGVEWKNASAAWTMGSTEMRFARHANDAYATYWKGLLDEVRAADAPRSADWAWACYMNQGESHASFVEYGAVSEVGGGIVWSDTDTTNIVQTAAWASATVNTNLTEAVLVWDTSDQGTDSTNDWPVANRLSLGAQSAGDVTAQMTGLSSDTEYTWRFHGETGSTNGWSDATTFRTKFGAAQVPVFTNATVVGVSIELGWQDNASGETGYVLQRAEAPGGPYTFSTILPANTTSYEDAGLDLLTAYYYQLAATNTANGSGTGFAACQTNATTDSTLDGVADTILFNFDNDVAESSLNLFSPVDVNEFVGDGVVVSDLEVISGDRQVRVSGGQAQAKAQKNGITHRFTVTIPGDISMYFTELSFDVGRRGLDPSANAWQVTTSAGSATPASGTTSVNPTSITVSLGGLVGLSGTNVTFTILETASGNNSTWSHGTYLDNLELTGGIEAPPAFAWSNEVTTSISSTSALATAEVGSALTETVLVWEEAATAPSPLPGSTNDWSYRASLGPTNAGSVSAQMTGLASDTEYLWRFYGVDATTSAWSSAASFSTGLSTGQAPSFVSAVGTVSGLGILLNWIDNADFETGYVLRRAEAPGGPYSFSTNLPMNTTSYEDEGLSLSTTYYYQLAATNAATGTSTGFASCQTNAATTDGTLDGVADTIIFNFDDNDAVVDVNEFVGQGVVVSDFVHLRPGDPTTIRLANGRAEALAKSPDVTHQFTVTVPPGLTLHFEELSFDVGFRGGDPLRNDWEVVLSDGAATPSSGSSLVSSTSVTVALTGLDELSDTDVTFTVLEKAGNNNNSWTMGTHLDNLKLTGRILPSGTMFMFR